jgi:hypothetical protein
MMKFDPRPVFAAHTQEDLKFRIARGCSAAIYFEGMVTQEAVEKLIEFLEFSKDTFPTQAELEVKDGAPKV